MRLCAALGLTVLPALVGAQQPAPQQPAAKRDTITMDARASQVAHDRSVFGPDPSYPGEKYDFQAQLDIYGAKRMNRTQRPLIELGREMYGFGPFRRSPTILGSHNILIPQLLVYGDVRSAGGYNDFGTSHAGRGALRVNLDVDLKLTATERIHAFFRPAESGDGQFSRFDFTGDSTGFSGEFDGEPQSLFMEGDLGAILGGLSGRDAPFDMPVTGGLIPMLFQNGIWIEDAFIGGAFALPARNSKALDWSNFDLSFFYGGGRLSNPTVGTGTDNGQIAGATAFIETKKGYLEIGYANIFGTDSAGRNFHSVGLSFTRRYGGRVSNSLRYIAAIGKDSSSGGNANGHLFLIESSLITSRPSTVVPYLNVFYGIDSPVSAARDPGAGGILKNTGLNFEADAITGFPSLDPTARDAAGGALGINLLGKNLNRQLVLEVAATAPVKKTFLLEPQYGAGIRIQQPLTNALILRIDGIYGLIGSGADNTISGARLELRYKL